MTADRAPHTADPAAAVWRALRRPPVLCLAALLAGGCSVKGMAVDMIGDTLAETAPVK